MKSNKKTMKIDSSLVEKIANLSKQLGCEKELILKLAVEDFEEKSQPIKNKGE